MICLVWGPSASGKSAWAETRACELARGASSEWVAPEAASANGVRPAPDETETAAPVRLAYFATMQRASKSIWHSGQEKNSLHMRRPCFLPWQMPW